jgi:hypothetical protein
LYMVFTGTVGSSLLQARSEKRVTSACAILRK